MRESVQGFQLGALMARFDLTKTEWTIIAPLRPEGEAVSGPAGRSQGFQRHLLRVAHRNFLARPAGSLQKFSSKKAPLTLNPRPWNSFNLFSNPINLFFDRLP
jgi:hypothetical protein